MATITRTTTPPEKAARTSAAPIAAAIADLRDTGNPGEAIVLEYANANAASTSRTRIKKVYGGDDLDIYATGNQLVIRLVEPGKEDAPKAAPKRTPKK